MKNRMENYKIKLFKRGYVYRYKIPEDKCNVLGDNVTLCIRDEPDVATLSDGMKQQQRI